MSKSQKGWVYSPPRPPKPKAPEAVKIKVTTAAEELVEATLKPKHVKPPPPDEQFNYIVDIYVKWYRSYFYFCAQYACPGPRAIAPFFETKFARLEYAGSDRFHLAFMRYTEQWLELYQNLSLNECLKAIRDEPHFQP